MLVLMLMVILSLSFASMNQMMLLKPNRISTIISLKIRCHWTTMQRIIHKFIIMSLIPKKSLFRLVNEIKAAIGLGNNKILETNEMKATTSLNNNTILETNEMKGTTSLNNNIIKEANEIKATIGVNNNIIKETHLLGNKMQKNLQS